ncbi:MAG: DUF4291 domain-containing protein [Actinobacteria bacterium HGW-Actinobacteria-2]|nr:MAG: DUF4291 domain-containing protein [Actinobacteria bacterium HGW-Actinobacteria-2]
MASQLTPFRQVRAVFDDREITVYQAYSPEIAGPAVAAGTFVAPFSFTRMTWIKPSFLWMMYRCGWAAKPGQERVLAVRITRAGFEEILSSACLTHYDPDVHPSRDAWQAQLADSPARVQWDPERTMTGAALPYRSLQVGLTGPLVERYANEWISGITDITEQLSTIREGAAPLPAERPYPLPAAIIERVAASQ